MLEFIEKKSKEKQTRRAENFFWKAMEMLNLDQHGQAVKELESAIELDSENVLMLLSQQADDYYDESKILEALTLTKVLFHHKNKDGVLANRLGNIYRKLGEPKKANELYKQAISLNREDDSPLLNMAASLSKTPFYDKDIRILLKRHIDYRAFLIPKSTYPRDPKIIGHLTEMLNMKQFFGRVERLQELILKKTLQQEEPDFDKMSILVERLKEKIDQKLEEERSNPNVPRLLNEAIKMDWNQLAAFEKDRFLWDVLNLGLFILRDNGDLESLSQKNSEDHVKIYDFQLAIDCFVKLKMEQYSYKYLDMILSLSQTLAGDRKAAIEELKEQLKSSPSDRYININLGLLYHLEGNRLMSLVYLIKGASILNELGGACHLTDIIESASAQHRNGNLKKALKLYQVASLETDSIEILTQIGDILVSLHRYPEAVQPYREILRIEPNSEIGKSKLLQIQEHFVFLGDEFFSAKEFVKASDYFERALEIKETKTILSKAMKSFKLQGEHKREFEMNSRLHKMIEEEERAGKEAERRNLIQSGLDQMRSQDYQKAIRQFKEALRIRMDKEVVMFLSYIYKKLNQKIALQELMQQWNKDKK